MITDQYYDEPTIPYSEGDEFYGETMETDGGNEEYNMDFDIISSNQQVVFQLVTFEFLIKDMEKVSYLNTVTV